MHIGFQRSGGRGEYEVVGTHSGFSANSLQGCSFSIRGPDDLVRDTGLSLVPGESGKQRLRSSWAARFQIGRSMAAMLLLPDPTRTYAGTAAGVPVARSKGYVLSRIGFGPDTAFETSESSVTISPVFVDLENTTDTESIGVEKRWQRIVLVYEAMDRLPTHIRSQLMLHRDFLESGQPVTEELTKIVRDLSASIEHAPGGTGWTENGDPLPELEVLLGISADAGPTLPPPDDLGEDETEVKARSAHEYRLQKSRGSAGRQFSLAIRGAYESRCLFCGVS